MKVVRMHPTNRRRAFTLIELLVVVSIIALLVSILLPALNKARQSARKAVCGANLHSVGQTVIMFAQDFNGQLLHQVLAKGLYRDYDEMEYYSKDIIKTGIRVDVVHPYQWQLLKESYGATAESFFCPGLIYSKIKTYLDADELPEGGDKLGWGKYQYIGYVNLCNLYNMGQGDPRPDLRLSAKDFSDRPDKVMAADLTRRNDEPDLDSWSAHQSDEWIEGATPPSVVAHKNGSKNFPVGANHLLLDGSVHWRNANQLGRDDQPANEAEGKWDATGSASADMGRDYYW